MIEPTKDELKNGWTAESLEKYHKERELITSKNILEPKIVKPDAQKGYNPLRWRE